MSDQTTPIYLGGLVRWSREAAGLSIQRLADLSGTSYTTVSRIELGSEHTPYPASLAKIVLALKIPVDALKSALSDEPKLLQETLEWIEKSRGLEQYREFVSAGTLRFLRGSGLPEDLMLVSPHDVVCRVQVGGPGNTPEALEATIMQLAEIVEKAGWIVRVVPEIKRPA